jgi:hypothetical protein
MRFWGVVGEEEEEEDWLLVGNSSELGEDWGSGVVRGVFVSSTGSWLVEQEPQATLVMAKCRFGVVGVGNCLRLDVYPSLGVVEMEEVGFVCCCKAALWQIRSF